MNGAKIGQFWDDFCGWARGRFVHKRISCASWGWVRENGMPTRRKSNDLESVCTYARTDPRSPLPIGPKEGQLFYLQKQVGIGLKPPPYK